jgi:hypothetical protein
MVTHLPDGRVRCRARIRGRYQGKDFDWIDPETSKGSQFIQKDGDPSTAWWIEGNMGCDCNRAEFVGKKDLPCGTEICIVTVECVDYNGPTLRLNEVKNVRTPGQSS